MRGTKRTSQEDKRRDFFFSSKRRRKRKKLSDFVLNLRKHFHWQEPFSTGLFGLRNNCWKSSLQVDFNWLNIVSWTIHASITTHFQGASAMLNVQSLKLSGRHWVHVTAAYPTFLFFWNIRVTQQNTCNASSWKSAFVLIYSILDTNHPLLTPISKCSSACLKQIVLMTDTIQRAEAAFCSN